MPNVVRPCVLSNGGNFMPRPTLPTVCAVQGRQCHVTPDVAHRVCSQRALMSRHARRCRPCVRSSGGDVMPRPTSSDRACSPRVVMSCHARRHSTVCAVQRRRWHAMPDVVRPCLPSKGYDGMPRSTSFDRLCCPKAMMACHARRSSTVCAAQR